MNAMRLKIYKEKIDNFEAKKSEYKDKWVIERLDNLISDYNKKIYDLTNSNLNIQKK